MPLFKRLGQLGMTRAEAEMLDIDLLIGGRPLRARSDQEADALLREAWALRRETLMQRMPAGRRPGAWWRFETGEDAPWLRPEGMGWLEHDLAQLRYIAERDMTAAEAQEVLSRCSGEEPNPRELAERAVVLGAFPFARSPMRSLVQRDEPDKVSA